MDMSFVFGCSGAGFAELLHWAGLRRRSTFPIYVRTLSYWIITALLILAGGIVSYATHTSVDGGITNLTSLVIGFAAPAFVKGLSKALLRTSTLGGEGPAEPRPTWKTFLTA